MSPADPFEELARRNPIPDPAVLPEPVDDAAASELLARVLHAGPPGANDRHRRRGRRILIPLVAVAAVATAAAAWVATRPADDPTGVACYRDVDLGADIVVAEPVAGDAVRACAPAWSEGPFGFGEPPPLMGCVLETGLAGVFPAMDGDPCDRLGLAHLSSSDNEQPPIVEVQERLAEEFGSRCVPLAEAEPLVSGELTRTGLDSWTVVAPSTVPPDRPCASVAIDAAAQAITIVPIPATPSG